MYNSNRHSYQTASTCIGFIAGLLTTLSFLPQVMTLCRVQRKAQVDRLSLTMYVVYSFGTVLWIVYGMLMEDFMVMFFNFLATILVWYCIIKIVVVRYYDSFYENTQEDSTEMQEMESNREEE
jgi:MtN3 and saliva related transmembrane protein